MQTQPEVKAMRAISVGRCICCFALFAASLSLLNACGGGGASFTPAPAPPAQNAPATASQPPPSSVQITSIEAPDTPAGGVAIGNDGAVYLDGASHFMRFANNAFTQYAYVAQFGQTVGALDGVNALANAPGGDVATIVQEGGAPPFRYDTALAPSTGQVIDSHVVTAFQDEGLVAVARGQGGTLWVSGYEPGIGGGFINNGVVTIQDATLSAISSFGPTDVLGSFALAANGAMFAANNPFYNSQIPSTIYQLNAATGAILKSSVLPSGSSVSQLAAGPDGAIWFTDPGLNKIGRIDASGVVTYYAVPTQSAGLAGITAVSDNAMWFTESNGGKIGRIGTDGTVTEYTISQAGAHPMGIAAGAPGACIPGTLYFAESNGLGKITFSS